jgi:ATP adenylyltransferase
MGEYFFNFEKLAYIKKPKPEGCILCLIAEGSDQVENLTVWENDRFLVTVNLYPYNPAHLLVAPKRHVVDIRELDEQEERQMSTLERKCLDLLEAVYAPAGFNIGYNMGRPAGASIEHLHLHIIPRYPHETGIADLIAGKRVLVENPVTTADRLREELRRIPLRL